MNNRPVLIVEDDATSAEFLQAVLEMEGFDPRIAGSVAEAISALDAPASRFDAIVLDLGLPDGDGRDVCKWLRAKRRGIPTLMLTGSDSEQDVISGLDAGATDFVTKPCQPQVIVARLQAMLRTIEGSDQDYVAVGPWGFRAADRTLLDRHQGVRRRLTVNEAAILKLLYERRGSVVRRQELLWEVWGYKPNIRTHTVETHMYRLRKKIEVDPVNRPVVLTAEGGYRLAAA